MLCLKNDVFLLTDVFQNSMDTCNKTYDVIPFCSYGTPCSRWKAGFKLAGVRSDYINDDKPKNILENNMRGGPSNCMGNCHVKRGEIKILYEDMNNPYGWSMSQYLPTRDFHAIDLT